jgi:RNA recognition motif-containing protein
MLVLLHTQNYETARVGESETPFDWVELLPKKETSSMPINFEPINIERIHQSMEKHKIVVRNLPWNMSEEEFKEIISKFSKAITFWYFAPANPYFTQVSSTAYLNFEDCKDIPSFQLDMAEITYKSKNYKLGVEYAPYQRVPKLHDATIKVLTNTIESDKDYQKFVKELEKPIEKEVSAEIKLERQEEEDRLRGHIPIKITPLMQEIMDKRNENRGKVQQKPRKAPKRAPKNGPK